MASYMILTPASGRGKDHEATCFVRDGFSLAAFLVPGIWLLWHRLWLLAIGALLIEAIGFGLIRLDGYSPAGFAILLAMRILAAVEGRMAYVSKLLANEWHDSGLVSARSVGEAEEIYFSSLPPEEERDIPKADWDISTGGAGNVSRGAVLGLIGYDGGRA